MILSTLPTNKIVDTLCFASINLQTINTSSLDRGSGDVDYFSSFFFSHEISFACLQDVGRKNADFSALKRHLRGEAGSPFRVFGDHTAAIVYDAQLENHIYNAELGARFAAVHAAFKSADGLTVPLSVVSYYRRPFSNRANLESRRAEDEAVCLFVRGLLVQGIQVVLGGDFNTIFSQSDCSLFTAYRAEQIRHALALSTSLSDMGMHDSFPLFRPSPADPGFTRYYDRDGAQLGARIDFFFISFGLVGGGGG